MLTYWQLSDTVMCCLASGLFIRLVEYQKKKKDIQRNKLWKV